MKRIIIIGMFLPLLYTTLGYYGQFIVLQWRAKEAAREAWIATLPDAAFVRIDEAAVDAGGRWEERGREFSFDDHMYDVIRTRRVGEKTWLFCLDDENEERLDHQSETVTRANQEHADKKTAHTLCIATGNLFCERLGWTIAAPGSVLPEYGMVDAYALPGGVFDIAGPPPKG